MTTKKKEEKSKRTERLKFLPKKGRNGKSKMPNLLAYQYCPTTRQKEP